MMMDGLVIDDIAIKSQWNRFIPPDIQDVLDYYPTYWQLMNTSGKQPRGVASYIMEACRQFESSPNMKDAPIEEKKNIFGDYLRWVGGTMAMMDRMTKWPEEVKASMSVKPEDMMALK